jgi:hypothetical protein
MTALWVLVRTLPASEGVDVCPWGLLVPADNGVGFTVHRCGLLAGHKEDHRECVLYPQARNSNIRVVTQWGITQQSNPHLDGNGHDPQAVP